MRRSVEKVIKFNQEEHEPEHAREHRTSQQSRSDPVRTLMLLVQSFNYFYLLFVVK